MTRNCVLIDENEDAKCYITGEYHINDKVYIKFPTVREIMCDIGELNYWRILFTLTATTSDMIAQLDDMGLDWEKTDDFDVFAVNFSLMPKQDIGVLFPELVCCDFDLMINQDNDMTVLRDEKNDINIDKNIYDHIVDYLRHVHGLKKNVIRAANAYTHRDIIEDAHREIEYASKRKKKKNNGSQFKNYISYLMTSMCLKQSDVLDMNVCLFFDCVKRCNAVEQAKTMPFLMYYGMVDASNKEAKNSLDPMRSL